MNECSIEKNLQASLSPFPVQEGASNRGKIWASYLSKSLLSRVITFGVIILDSKPQLWITILGKVKVRDEGKLLKSLINTA